MRTILAAAAVACLVLAGCSKDDGRDTTATTTDRGAATTAAPAGGGARDYGGGTPTTTADQGDDADDEASKTVAGGGTVDVDLYDFSFGPKEIKAEPGSTITLELHNEGQAPHTFTLARAGVDEELQPGQEKQVRVTVPSAGGGTFVCRFHQSRGMTGRFVG